MTFKIGYLESLGEDKGFQKPLTFSDLEKLDKTRRHLIVTFPPWNDDPATLCYLNWELIEDDDYGWYFEELRTGDAYWMEEVDTDTFKFLLLDIDEWG